MIRNSRRVVALAIAGAFTLAPAVSGCGAGRSPETASPSQLTEGVNVATDSGINIRNLFVLGPTPGHKLAAGTSAAVYAAVINDSRDGKADKLVAVSSPVFQQTAKITGGELDLPPGQLVRLGSAAPGGKDATKAAQQKAGASGTGKPDAKASGQPGGKPSGGATTEPTAKPSGAATGSAAADPTSTPGDASTAGPDAQPADRPGVVLAGLSKDLLGGESIELTLRFQRGGTVKVLAPVVPHAEPYVTYAPAATPTSTSIATPESTPPSGPATSASPSTSASPKASSSTGPATGGSPSPATSAAHG